MRNGSGEQLQVTIYGTDPTGTSVVYWDGPMLLGGTCGLDTAAELRVYVGAARDLPVSGWWEERLAIHDGADHEVVIPPLGRG